MIRPDGTVDDRIVTTLTPADRIPSVGHQLTIEPVDDITRDRLNPPCGGCGRPVLSLNTRNRGGLTDADGCTSRGQCARFRKPERLTLWDQPAELWSTDR